MNIADKQFVELNVRIRQLGTNLIKHNDVIAKMIIEENAYDSLKGMEAVFEKLNKL